MHFRPGFRFRPGSTFHKEDGMEHQAYIKRIKKAGLLGISGAGLLFLYLQYGIGIPCPIHFITGFQCPGCGNTRMAAALLRGHFREAFLYNPLSFVLLPLFFFIFAGGTAAYIRTGHFRVPVSSRILWGIAAAYILFAVCRNLPLLMIPI